MKINKAKILSSIIAIAVLLNCGMVAFAAQHTEYPWGGVWNWGERPNSISGDKEAYSAYELKASKEHNTNGVHSTLVTGKTAKTSGWVQPGQWANSAIPCKWNAVERCFYNAQDLNGNPKA